MRNYLSPIAIKGPPHQEKHLPLPSSQPAYGLVITIFFDIYSPNDILHLWGVENFQFHITITNKICMGSALGHIKRGKIITISNISLYPISLYPISLYPISLYPLCTVLVKKKDGTMRLAVDYRTLNNETKRDSYPLPEVHDILDKLHGSKYYPSVVGA